MVRLTSRSSTNISSVAVDAYSGDLYVADGSANSVTMISSDDTIAIIAGSNTYGAGGYSGDGGLAAMASLNGPTGLTVDARRELLYIADTGNNVIRMVAKGTGIITTVAGLGVAGYSGDGGQATSASMSQPRGTAIDPTTGNLYITDTGNNMIRMVSKSTGIISAVAGNGGAGLGGYAGDGGLAATARLNGPTALAFSPTRGDLYIADTGNNVIRMVASNTGIISTVAGNGNTCYSVGGELVAPTTLHMPSGLAIDAVKGVLYIADSGNNAIRMLNNAGIISTVVGDDLGIDTGHGGPAISAALNNPHSVALDTSSGTMYVVDSHQSNIRDVSGTPALEASSPTMAPTVGKVASEMKRNDIK